MKLPVVHEMERVMAATTLPTLLLGGDPDGDPDETYAAWQAALALPVGPRAGGRADHALPGRRRRGEGGRHRRLPGALRSLSLMSELYLPAGAAADGPYDLEVTPTSAGWGYSSLRVLTLTAGEEHEFACDGEEIIVVPLSGGATVTTGGQTFELAGRSDVFAGPTDIVYLPAGSTATLTSTDGGRYALCGAGQRRRPAGPLRSVAEVPVELRGAGQSSRQVRNFGTPEALAAGCDHRLRGDHPGWQLVVLPRAQARRGDRDRVRAGGDLLLRDRRRPER